MKLSWNSEMEDIMGWSDDDSILSDPDSVTGGPTEIIDINVGGELFQTYASTLGKYPESLLGNYERRRQYFNKETGELYFDRHSEAFESIIHYYQSGGELYIPTDMSIERFIYELVFFDIDKSVIEKLELDNGLCEPPETIELPTFRPFRTMWKFLEYPDSSRAAKIFAILSVIVIVISLALFVIETIPSVHNHTEKIDTSWMFIASTIVIIWFTVEFFLRLLTCPNKLRFFVEPGNIIDLLSILPYYLAFVTSGSDSRILSVIRVIRVLRVLKLSRHSSSLKVLARSLVAAREELVIIVMFVCIFVLLFGSLVYYAEEAVYHKVIPVNTTSKITKPHFQSIPDSAWWAIVTITSAGYGDMAPKTVWGRLFGSFATVFSILVCVLPVPSIVSHFTYYTQMEKNRQSAVKRKLEESFSEKSLREKFREK